MATNSYFSNVSYGQTQNLVEDLVIEAIKMFGIDVWYISRTIGEENDLINEASRPTFSSAQLIEMYVKTVDSFGGDGDFLSKFNLQIRDSITFSVARKRFAADVGNYTGATRPKEGDLIYFPMNKKIFEVTFVEHESVFYQLGQLYVYDLKCELFEFSNETFSTGIDEIDSVYRDIATSSPEAIEDLNNFDVFADNDVIQDISDDILDFSEDNPYSAGGRW